MRKKIVQYIRKIDTPFYIYDKQKIQQNADRLRKHFAPCHAEIYYAIKANTSIVVLRIIRDAGFGAEVVSPGELYVARKAGFAPEKILYNNIARSEKDVFYALRNRVRSFNFEALDQAEVLEACARRLSKKIEIFARINPGIFPETHPHLSTGAPSSKFGLETEQLASIVKTVRGFQYARMVGIHSHIGSQILTPMPFVRNVRKVRSLIAYFRKHEVPIQAVNLGGGFGIVYHPNESPLEYRSITQAYADLARSCDVKIMLEPGRSVIGNAGIVVTRVISIKKRCGRPLYIIDAGMTENPRPALYQAYHHIDTITRSVHNRHRVRVAGPLCENSDEFGAYDLPALKRGDVLSIHNCGAYTRTMASNYNGRLLPPEYLLDRNRLIMVRKAQRFTSLIHNEIY